MSFKDKFMKSGLFVKTGNSKRYFKASLEGFAGSGKSLTMGLIARGIWEREGGRGSVALIDTEESAKFLGPFFEEVGLVEGETFFVSRSRSLVDFERVLKMAEEEQALLLIDSVTHIHEEMVAQYLKDRGRTRLKMEDHMVLKPFWKEHFSVPYVRANCHAIFTGRAAWEYEPERNEETGKIKDFVKSGVKMRGDNETAFEPDLLVLMTRCDEVNSSGITKVWREGMVVKSRFAPLDGKLFVNPSFEDFKPVYDFLMRGDEHTGGHPETSMRGMFADPTQSWAARRRTIEGLLGELKGLYDSYVPGSGAKEKKIKADIAFAAFGKRSWEALEDSQLDVLQAGYQVASYLMAHLDAMPDDLKEFPAWLEQQKVVYQETLIAVKASADIAFAALGGAQETLVAVKASQDMVSSSEVNDDDGVPLTPGPETPTLPQVDTPVEGERTDSSNGQAFTTEDASEGTADDQANVVTPEPPDDVPAFDVGADGFVTHPGVTLLVNRADAHGNKGLLRKLREQAGGYTFDMCQDAWVKVAEKQSVKG